MVQNIQYFIIVVHDRTLIISFSLYYAARKRVQCYATMHNDCGYMTLALFFFRVGRALCIIVLVPHHIGVRSAIWEHTTTQFTFGKKTQAVMIFLP